MQRRTPGYFAGLFLEKIKSNIHTSTNKDTINEILAHLHLDGFVTRDKDFSDFLEKMQSSSIDMELFLEKLKQDLLANKSLCLLLAYIEKNNLISEEEVASLAESLNRQVNILCLFEAFTVSMANSSLLMEDVYNHIIKRRGNHFSGNPFSNFVFGLPSGSSLFERLKIISVEVPMLSLLFHRVTGDAPETSMDIKDFIKKFGLTSLNANLEAVNFNQASASAVSGMGINILEANWEDATHMSKEKGGIENAMAGFGLIGLLEEREYLTRFIVADTVLPQGGELDKDGSYNLLPGLRIDVSPKKVSRFEIDKQWRDLYNSWNLRFVIGNFNSLFLPLKLLLPSVFSSEPENYKELRTLSLFLFANLFICERVAFNPFFKDTVGLKNADAILTKWGEINKEYAEELLNTLCPDAITTPEGLYQDIFSDRPTFSLVKHIFGFFRHTEAYRIAIPSATGQHSKDKLSI